MQASKIIEACTNMEKVVEEKLWLPSTMKLMQMTNPLLQKTVILVTLYFFTDGPVVRGRKLGLAFTARDDGVVGRKRLMQPTSRCRACRQNSTISRVVMGEAAWLFCLRRMYSLSTLEKVRGEAATYTQIGSPHIRDSRIQKITCTYCPGYSGVMGNEVADKLAGEAAIFEKWIILFNTIYG